MSNYQNDLVGVANKIQLGEGGHQVDASNATYFKMVDKDNSLLPVKGAQSTASDEYVTQAQLDGVSAEITGEWNAYSYDATASLTQLSGEGSGDNGAILRGDKYKVENDGSILGTSVNAGAGLVALVDSAPLSGTNPTPQIGTHWLIIEIKDANDLADGTTTEAVGGKVGVKDGGVSTDKLDADAVTGDKIADDSVDSEHIAAGALDNEHYAAASITGGKVANATIEKAKLVAAVQTTLSNADTQYGTRNDNFESAIGGSFDSDNDSTIAAQTNYLTGTTIVSQLAQADARMKLDNDDNAKREVTITTASSATVNVGASIKSGRTLTRVSIVPDDQWNGTTADIEVGVSGNTGKYMNIANLYNNNLQHKFHADKLTSDTQVIVTFTKGDATAGSCYILVEHC